MNEHDDFTTRLHRSLTDQSDTMAGAHLGLADVKGRARAIRRRRTATAVVGVAAAVGLLIPTVAMAGHTGGRPEPAPATQTPSDIPSPTRTAADSGHQPAPGVLDVSDLPTGAAPHSEYVTDGRVLHRIDGGTVDIATRYPVSSFVALSDGTHVWLTARNGTPYVEVQDGNGTLHDPTPSGWSLSVNHAHTVAAWTQDDGQVMVWNSGATQALAYGEPVPAGSDLRTGPVLGDHCGAPDDTCQVFVNVPAESGRQPWLVDVNGTQPYRDGSYVILTDGTESGLSIGVTELSDGGSCSALLGGGEFRGFTTCKNTLVSFSPDGKVILADPAYHDGIGNGVIAMYDLDGHRLFQRTSSADAQSFYPTAQWEDATHALAPVFQDGRWSIVRFATDGSMEYAVAPVTGAAEESPYVLATGGMPFGD